MPTNRKLAVPDDEAPTKADHCLGFPCHWTGGSNTKEAVSQPVEVSGPVSARGCIEELRPQTVEGERGACAFEYLKRVYLEHTLRLLDQADQLNPADETVVSVQFELD